MPESEKDIWRRKADQEKLEHAQRYPGYRFTPNLRSTKPLKRKVRRNGSAELARCREVAAMLVNGKEGDELERAVKRMDRKSRPELKDNSVPFSRTRAIEAIVGLYICLMHILLILH